MCVPWCLIRVSSVLGVGVVMHVLHLPDEGYVVLLGAARGCGGVGRGEYRLLFTLFLSAVFYTLKGDIVYFGHLLSISGYM